MSSSMNASARPAGTATSRRKSSAVRLSYSPRVRETLHGRALESAALLLGSEAALATFLGLSRPRLTLYLEGTAVCPLEVASKVARFLLTEDSQHQAAAD